MKMIKKVLFIFITICSLFLLVDGKVFAASTSEWKGESDCITKVKEEEEIDLYGVATYHEDLITSKVNGVAQQIERRTHWVDTQSWGNDTMLVNWTNSVNEHDWKGTKMTDLARQFEKENPGWIVVAGINADFFHISSSGMYPANCEPVNGSSQMGNLLKPFSDLSGGGGILGFKEDGSYIYGQATTSENEYVEVLDEQGNVLKSVEINNLNKVPTETGVTLLTPNTYGQYPKSFDLTGYKVFVVDYKLHRLDRRTQKVYIKGSVTEVREGTTEEKVERNCGYAYLVSKDGSLDGVLEVGTTLRCQTNYTGSWEGVINASGYYAQMLKDGQSLFYDSVANKEEISKIYDYSYINCDKNRTFIGFKEDNSPVMVVSQRAQGLGHTYYEEAEILKELGCVNGFVLDGGGSACMIIRTETGSFEVVNECQDGSPRSDANIIMIVTRDPGITPIVEKSSRFTCDINVLTEGLALTDQISNIRVTVGDQTKPFNGSPVHFDNLEEETTYTAIVEYDFTSDGQTVTRFEKRTFKTASFVKPLVMFKTEALPEGLKITKNTEGIVKNVIVHVGDEVYNMGDVDSFEADDLIMDTEYLVSFEYDVEDPESGRIYHYHDEAFLISTLAYRLPTITRFEFFNRTEDKFTFKYAYTDKDDVVVRAYLDVNGEQVELTKKSGSVTCEGIYLTDTPYKFKLVIEYEHEGEKGSISSDEINFGLVEKEKKGCKKKNLMEVMMLTSSISVVLYLLKKKH